MITRAPRVIVSGGRVPVRMGPGPTNSYVDSRATKKTTGIEILDHVHITIRYTFESLLSGPGHSADNRDWTIEPPVKRYQSCALYIQSCDQLFLFECLLILCLALL